MSALVVTWGGGNANNASNEPLRGPGHRRCRGYGRLPATDESVLAASAASAIAVAILSNVAGSGLLAKLLAYAFLAGLITSGIATTLSFRPDVPKTLRWICRLAFGAYAATAAAFALWVVVARPPFG